MKRALMAVLVLVLVGGVVAGQQRRYEGRPRLVRGSEDRMYLWGDDNGRFNVRVTSDRPNTRITGVIHAWGGTFTDVRLVRREAGDWVRLSRDGRHLFYNFQVSRLLDGFDFMTDASSITASFLVNGTRAQPRQINLGRRGVAPLANPFSLGITVDDGRAGPPRGARVPDTVPDDAVEVDRVIPEAELDEESKR